MSKQNVSVDDIIENMNTQRVRGSSSKTPMTMENPDVVILGAVTVEEEMRSKDAIFKTLKGSPADPKVLSAVVEELAEEIFALKVERSKLETMGKDIANTSGKRVIALKALIDTSIKLKEMTHEQTIDFNSPQMRTIMKLIFQKITDTLVKASYSKQDQKIFFQVFNDTMASFETEAQRMVEQDIS